MNAVAMGEVLSGAVFASIYSILLNFVQGKDHAPWKGRPNALIVVFQGLVAAGCIIAALATDPQPVRVPIEQYLFPLFATGILNIAIQYLFVKAHALEDVSLVTPILASTPTIVIFTSMLILHEYPTWFGWLGIWLLALGTYSLNLQKLRVKLREKGSYREWRVWFAPIAALRESRGVRLAFLSSLIGAVAINFDGIVARDSNVLFGFGCTMAIVAVANLVPALWQGQFRGLKPSKFLWLGPLFLAIVYAAANVITNLAYHSSLVAYVGTLKRLMIPITIILAYFILKEKENFKDRLLGGALIAIGAILIGLA